MKIINELPNETIHALKDKAFFTVLLVFEDGAEYNFFLSCILITFENKIKKEIVNYLSNYYLNKEFVDKKINCCYFLEVSDKPISNNNLYRYYEKNKKKILSLFNEIK